MAEIKTPTSHPQEPWRTAIEPLAAPGRPGENGSTDGSASLPVVRSAPGRSSLLGAAGEVWAYRELLYFLTWRDIKVRYKQTALGASWAILQPLLTMLVFAVVFGHLAKIPSEGVAYPLFAYVALLPWTFFSNALTLTSMSLVMTPDLVTKVYFPRLSIPIASVLGGVVDFFLGFLVLIGLMVYYHVVPGPQALLVVPLALLVLVTALGVGFWLSALNVEYRDVKYVVPFLSQFWLFATPIAYPATLLHEPWRTVLGLNPLSGVVEGFRWALLGTSTAPGPIVAASTGMALLIFVSGIVYFRRVEGRFADVI